MNSKKPIHFSDLYNIDKEKLNELGVFDPILNFDTKVFVEHAKHLNARSARTSCGVEGIVAKEKPLSIKIDHSRSNAVYAKMKKRLQEQN
ncbi:hypothetical protein [Legionella spiritensis]|uniref:hypothetical protein n=1 Tax=Legionella spiritensis TaxID=452 RepID=UPI000F6CCE88|nr:hypothetical protein [Legionella spiritensis]VEG89924.1 Uncharacterised protein [Legionella spiritensis]